MRYRKNSACQRVETFDRLATDTGATSVPITVQFRVPIVDARLRVKISVLFIPTSGTATSGLTATLWLRETELDLSGVSGATIPSTNIEGTSAAPSTIPATAGLQGYSREFQSAADYIEGTATFTGAGPSSGGSWVLQCRFQPESVRFTEPEWNEIEPKCNPSVDIGVGIF